MAGLYPDVPAPRMAYDRDGTIGFWLDAGTNTVIAELPGSTLAGLNDETNNNFPYVADDGHQRWLALIFPEPRNIVGYRALVSFTGSDYNPAHLHSSVDTTNGIDGTWVLEQSPWSMAAWTQTGTRSGITNLSFGPVKAVRFRMARSSFGSPWYFKNLHLYGSVADFNGLDTLRIWHPTLDEPLDDPTSSDGAFMDWGDVARGTMADRTFRIKNNSQTLTANDINIVTQVPTNTSPTLQSQFEYSNGGAFGSSLNIGNLSPGLLSSVITVRKTTASNAAVNVWTLRTLVEATSWS